MRARLIAAFIVVALLAALASAWVTNLIVPFYPSLGRLIRPALISDLLGSYVPGTGLRGTGLRGPAAAGAPGPGTALAFALAASGLLLATITGLAFAAARRVLARRSSRVERNRPTRRCRAVGARGGGVIVESEKG